MIFKSLNNVENYKNTYCDSSYDNDDNNNKLHIAYYWNSIYLFSAQNITFS